MAQQAAPSSATHALDNLQAMVNLVLVQTGRFLNDPSMRKNQQNARQAIPVALERFHASLDELEDELHRAKTVMRRDLAVLQANRIKREEAEAAERKKLETAASASKNAQEAKVSTNEQGSEVPNKGSVNIETTDLDGARDTKPISDPMIIEESIGQGISSNGQKKAPPIKTDGDSLPTKNTQTASSIDDLFGPTPTTGGLNESDFNIDEIFGSLSGLSPAGDNPEGSTTQNETAELDLNMLDSTVSSLLPGIESYANAGSDADPSKKPVEKNETTNDTTNKPDDQTQPNTSADTQPTVQQDQQDEDMGLFENDSTFNELFNWTGDDAVMDGADGDEFNNAFYGFEDA